MTLLTGGTGTPLFNPSIVSIMSFKRKKIDFVRRGEKNGHNCGCGHTDLSGVGCVVSIVANANLVFVYFLLLLL